MTTETAVGAGLAMPAPKPGKPPLSVNLYQFVQGANVQLLPLFPYEGLGDIVPCAVARRTLAGEEQGSFLHENDVDEVMICFGGNGRVRAGDVRVGPRTHTVGGAAAPADSFAVNCVTQRQVEQGEQMEAMTMICEQCSRPVFRYAFSGRPKDDRSAKGVHVLPTTEGSAVCIGAWNGDETLRTCDHCGHVNRPFPIEFWGWDRYMEKTGVAKDALRMLHEDGAAA